MAKVPIVHLIKKVVQLLESAKILSIAKVSKIKSHQEIVLFRQIKSSK